MKQKDFEKAQEIVSRIGFISKQKDYLKEVLGHVEPQEIDHVSSSYCFVPQDQKNKRSFNINDIVLSKDEVVKTIKKRIENYELEASKLDKEFKEL